MCRRVALILAFAVVTLGATATSAAAETVTSSFQYNKGALTAAGVDCDLSIYHTCGIGTFDGQPATSSFYIPTSGGDFVGDCFVYESVDELIELLDGSGSLTLHHTDVTICPPNGNWWRNQGFGSNGNPWHIETDWAVDSGTGVYADASGGGEWSAFWAGWAGSGQHIGDITTE